MSNTFMKNQGITKTIIHDNNKKYYNIIDWDSNYDGKLANISLKIDENGKKSNMNFELDNLKIAELLNVPSVNTAIDERLCNDFLDKSSLSYKNPTTLLDKFNKRSTSRLKKRKVKFIEPKYTHISSPSRDEEFVFPFTPMKPILHRRPKSHITHKKNRKMKSTSRKSNTYKITF
jgi:hypothetical protein